MIKVETFSIIEYMYGNYFFESKIIEFLYIFVMSINKDGSIISKF